MNGREENEGTQLGRGAGTQSQGGKCLQMHGNTHTHPVIAFLGLSNNALAEDSGAFYMEINFFFLPCRWKQSECSRTPAHKSNSVRVKVPRTPRTYWSIVY